MAVKRLIIDGFGQVELNNAAFRRDGRIEAQCKLDSATGKDFESVACENGMLLAVDRANRIVRFPDASEELPIGLVYTAEHNYDERTTGLKNFSLEKDSFLPRIGFPAVGDKWTTNCIAYNDTEYTTEDALITALEACATTAVYAGVDTTGGAMLVSATKPTNGPVLKVVEYTTMPDGQDAVMVQVLAV